MGDSTPSKLKALKFGFGARLCVVLSAAFVGLQVYTYNDNLGYWNQKSNCKASIDAQVVQIESVNSPSIGFTPVKDASRPSSGETDYTICREPAPISENDPLPVGCAAVVLAKDGDISTSIIRGPKSASRKAIGAAALRLGLSTALERLMAEDLAKPTPSFLDSQTESEYNECVAKRLGDPGKKPAFEWLSLLEGLAFLWGIYITGRFLMWK